MATVTMNGNEYKELMFKLHELETRLEDVTSWLKACVQLELPKDSFTVWGAGKMPGVNNAPLPPWMHDTLLSEVARQLMCQEAPVLQGLEAAGAHYYTPFDTCLSNHEWEEDVLPYFPGLEKVWEQARLSNEADQTALEEVKEDE